MFYTIISTHAQFSTYILAVDWRGLGGGGGGGVGVTPHWKAKQATDWPKLFSWTWRQFISFIYIYDTKNTMKTLRMT